MSHSHERGPVAGPGLTTDLAAIPSADIPPPQILDPLGFEPTDDPPTLPPSDTVERILETDAKLAAWRSTTVERSLAYKAAASEREASTHRWWVRALVASSTVGVTVTLAVAALLLWPTAPPAAIRVEPAVAASSTSPPVASPPIASPPVASPPVAAAVASQSVAAAPATAERATTTSAPKLVSGSTQLWSERGHNWVIADFNESRPIELRWLDGAGKPALDAKRCSALSGGTTRCYVGRAHQRTQYAVRTEGAAPGAWQVLACAVGTSHCATLGTWTIAPTPPRGAAM